MKKSLIAAVAASGLALGGLSVAQIASAESYGDQDDTAAVTEEVQTSEVEPIGVLPVQDIQTVQNETDPAPESPEASETEERRERGRRHGRHGGCGDIEAAAEIIGISEDELRAAVESGQTLAEIATENDVDPDALVDALVDSATERLEEKVEAGRITQEEAEEHLAEKTDRIEDRVFGESEEAA
ncbi:MAG: hypothetical protein ACR2PK_13870 [Acidimicrobiales bacterium]